MWTPAQTRPPSRGHTRNRPCKPVLLCPAGLKWRTFRRTTLLTSYDPCRKWHPDRNTDNKEEATQRFAEVTPSHSKTGICKLDWQRRSCCPHTGSSGIHWSLLQVAQAHETLTDPEKRKMYDQFGEDVPQQGGPRGQPGGMGFPVSPAATCACICASCMLIAAQDLAATLRLPSKLPGSLLSFPDRLPQVATIVSPGWGCAMMTSSKQSKLQDAALLHLHPAWLVMALSCREEA